MKNYNFKQNMINRSAMCAEIIQAIDKADDKTKTLTISFNPTTKMLITSNGYGKVLPTFNIRDFGYAIGSIDVNVPDTYHVTYSAGFVEWLSVDVDLTIWHFLESLESLHNA